MIETLPRACFPRVADLFVVDEAGGIGSTAQAVRRERRERLRFEVVAVRREAFESVPQAGQRTHFVPEP